MNDNQLTPRQLASARRREETRERYAEAVRLYAETSLTLKEIAHRCNLSTGAFSQHLRRNERTLVLRRHGIDATGKRPQDVKIIQTGQENVNAHRKYHEAVEACRSDSFIAMNVSQIARHFNVPPTGLANFMRRHYPDIIPQREARRSLLGLADNAHRGMSRIAVEQYREAVELYRTSDLTMQEAAARCGVTERGLLQHLCFYHKDILHMKREQRRQAQSEQRKPRGAMLGNGHHNHPSRAVVMKYAAAFALYKSTSLTMKEIVAQTGVPAQGFRFYLRRWHRALVLERSGIEAGEFDQVNIAKQRTRMKTVTAKYAAAIESLRRRPRPVAAVAREFGHNPEVFRQYLHKYEPELAARATGRPSPAARSAGVE